MNGAGRAGRAGTLAQLNTVRRRQPLASFFLSIGSSVFVLVCFEKSVIHTLVWSFLGREISVSTVPALLKSQGSSHG